MPAGLSSAHSGLRDRILITHVIETVPILKVLSDQWSVRRVQPAVVAADGGLRWRSTLPMT